MSFNTDKLNGVDFTPTPRTDEAAGHALGIINYNVIECSRNLERERDSLKSENENLKKLVGWSDGKLDVEELLTERDRLKRENERLRIENDSYLFTIDKGREEWEIAMNKINELNEHLRKCCDFDANNNPVVKGSTLHLHSKRTDGTICEMTLPVEPARKYCWYNTIEEAQTAIKDKN